MKPIEKLTVNVGNTNLYLEKYSKINPDTNQEHTDWKPGDISYTQHEGLYYEAVYNGDSWELASPNMFSSVCTNFFNDPEEFSKHVIRILNNDPTFNVEEYLKQEQENVNETHS